MNYRPQLEALRAELQNRGLPRAYIKRLLEELDDHFSDLTDDLVSGERNRDMSAARMPDYRADELNDRMGSPTELAIFAAEQYRARSFFGRHPILTFVVTPLPLLLVMCAIYWIAFAVPLMGIGFLVVHTWGMPSPDNLPMLRNMVFGVLSWELLALAPITTGWLLCRIANRNALDWRWPVAACLLLSLLMSLLQVTWKLRPGLPENAVFMIGCDVHATFQWLFLTWLPKFALALGIGLALVWREERRDRGEISDSAASLPTLPAA